MNIEVIIEDDRWDGLARLANVAVPAVLAERGLGGAFEVAILGCDDARIAVLNADFRGKPQPTNVLSWPSAARAPDVPPQECELGDIAISFDTCAREAGEQGKPFEAHVTHLLIHATLHLLGHDHIEDTEARAMESAEIEILAGLGFPDPYASDRTTPAGRRAGQDGRPNGSDGHRRIV